MDALSYSSVYQMTYLFIRTIQGSVINHVLNDSFQPFLIDLETAIKENHSSLKAVSDCVIEDFQNPDKYVKINFLHDLDHTVERLIGKKSETIHDFFSNLLVEASE